MKAVWALGQLGPQAQEAVPFIIPLLRDTGKRNGSTATIVAEALGRIQDPNAIPALIDYLETGHFKWEAAKALGRFGPQASSALDSLYILLARLEQNEVHYSHKIKKVKAAIKQIATGEL